MDNNCLVEVSGVKRTTSASTLQNCLENRKRSDGGDVNRVEIDRELGRAIALFEDPAAASRVCQKGSIRLDGEKITFSCPSEEDAKVFEETDRSIYVTGMPPGCTKDDLTYFFENRRKCPGGDVEDTRLNEKDQSAVIVFDSAEDAKRLRETETVQYEETTLHITPVPFRLIIPKRRYVKATSISRKTSKSTLTNFFENKRAGDCEIEDIVLNSKKHYAVILFKEDTAVERVLKQKNLTLHESTLDVAEWDGSEDDFVQEKTFVESDSDEHKGIDPYLSDEVDYSLCAESVEEVYRTGTSQKGRDLRCLVDISNIKPTTSIETLTDFLENQKRTSGGKVIKLFMERTQRRALALFAEPTVAARLCQRGSLSLEGETLALSYATDEDTKSFDAMDRSIQVTSLPSCSTDSLTFLFESKKYGECNVSDVQVNAARQSARVVFEKPEEATRFLEMKEVQFEKTWIKISPPTLKKTRQYLKVSGINRNTTTETLCNFLENKRNEGGEISDFVHNREQQFAIILFKDDNVPSRVVDKKRLSLEGVKLKLSIWDGSEDEFCELKTETEMQQHSPAVQPIERAGLKQSEEDSSRSPPDVKFKVRDRPPDTRKRNQKVTPLKPVIKEKPAYGFTGDSSRSFRSYRGGEYVDEQPNSSAGGDNWSDEHQRDAGIFSSTPERNQKGTPLKPVIEEKPPYGFTGDSSRSFRSYRGGEYVDEQPNSSAGGDNWSDEHQRDAGIFSSTPGYRQHRVPGDSDMGYSPHRRGPAYRSLAVDLGDKSEQEEHQHENTRIAIATGLGSGITRLGLKPLIAEINRKTSNNVLKYDLDPEKRIAYIRFRKLLGASTIRHNMTLGGSEVTVLPLDGIYMSCAENTKTFEVWPIESTTKEQLLELYFESSNTGLRNSCSVTDVVIDRSSGKGIITVKEEEAIREILHKNDFLIDNKMVDTRRLQPADPALLVSGPYEETQLLVKGLPDNIDANDIKCHFQQKCKIENITEIQTGIERVSFSRKVDYKSMCQYCADNPFRGVMLSVQRVAIPKAIRVTNIAEISENLLEMYFEAKKNGGGEIENISIDTDSAVISFKDKAVPARLMSKRHNLQSKVLHVEPFDADMSLPLSCFPSRNIPADIAVKINEKIETFLVWSEKAKKHIEKELESVNALIDWDGSTLKYNKQIVDSDFDKSEWEEKARAFLQRQLDNYWYHVCHIPEKVRESFEAKAKIEEIPTREDFLIDYQQDQVTIVGLRSEVDHYISIWEKAKQEAEKTDIELPIKRFQVKLLKKKNFAKLVKDKCSECETYFDQECIKFIGLSKNIDEAKDYLYKWLSGSTKTELDISKTLHNFFQVKEVENTINNELDQRKILALWDVTGTALEISALSKYELDYAKEIFENVFAEETIPLDEASGFALQLDEWKKMKASTIIKYSGILFICEAQDAKSVCVACRKENKDGIVMEIKDYLKRYAVFHRLVRMPLGTYKYFDRHCRKNVKAVEDSDVEKSLTVSVFFCGFKVNGTKESLASAIPKLDQLIQSVSVDSYRITRPGMPKMFYETKGTSLVADIERKEEVIIEIPHLEEIYNCFVEPVNGKRLYVAKTEMISYPVEVIVNAANAEMRHSGGLAADIAKAGGSSIQEECTAYVKRHGKLNTSDNFTSTAGSLPHAYIIHTVGPRWHNGKNDDEKQLSDAVVGCLQRATDLNILSLALPLISAGIYGFPPDVSARITLNSIEMFLKKHSTSLKEVHVVDRSSAAVKNLEDMLKAKYGEGKIEWSRHSRRPGTTLKASPQPSTTTRTAASSTRDYANGTRMSLIPGNIVKEKVDIIVNSTTNNLRLKGAGAISKTILSEGGSTIQQECDTQYPDGIKVGEFAVTSGGNLNCKQIYHAACPKYDSGKGNSADNLANLLKALLQKAHVEKMDSISIPTLGAGGLHFPKKIVAKIMLDEVDNFVKANERTSLKKVHIVVHPEDKETIHAFKQYLERVSESTVTSTAAIADPEAILPSVCGTATLPNVKTYKNGSKLTLVTGNIIAEKTEVIVNTTSSDLDLASAGAVSKNILKAGGDTLQQECKTKHPSGIKADEVAVTSAGYLPSKFIYHVACPKWDSGSGGSENTMRQLMKTMLQKADTDKIQSISFPALGTGGLHVPRHVAANIMFEEIEKFFVENPSTTVDEVHIVVIDRDTETIQVFHKKLQGSTDDQDQVSADDGDVAEMENTGQTHIGKCCVQVKKADITKETTNAIVNSTNDSLSFGGAVSKAIAKAGGQPFTDECEKHGTIVDGVALTKAGNLACNYVIHVTSESTGGWATCVQKALVEANKKQLTSMSFPALGTGGRHESPQKIADIMLDTIVEYCKTQNKSLTQVNICIFQDSMVADFKQSLGRCLSKTRVPSVTTRTQYNTTRRFTTGADTGILGAVADDVQLTDQGIPQNLADLTFTISAGSKKAIDQAKKRLDDFCDQECVLKTVSDTNIDRLDKVLLGRIKHKGNSMGVLITIGDNHITLEGDPKDILQINDDIHTILRQKNDEDSLFKELEAHAKQVHWLYKDEEQGGAFSAYGTTVSGLIEKAFTENKPDVQWRAKDGAIYKITFLTMTETIEGENSTTDVKRNVEGSVDYPSTWVPVDPKEVVKSFEVTAQSGEYTTVENLFKNDVPNATITKIERVQNPTLYGQYFIKKQQMPKPEEKTLWHGTAADAVQSINANGFNRSLSGKNATLYGKGAYFAVSAKYSANYAFQDANKLKRMYQCKVLTGEYTKGNGTLIVPPAKDPSNPHILYDSVVNDMKKPDMFVVFTDSQCYPEYLITFKA